MKKNTLLYTILGAVVVLGGGYYLYRRMKKSQEEKVAKLTNTVEEVGKASAEAMKSGAEKVITKTGDMLTDLGISVSEYFSDYNPYSVNTISSNLYLRDKPDSQGKIVGKFAKGTIIKAKPSEVKGWFAVSEDGTTVKGYVSKTYIKPQPSKK